MIWLAVGLIVAGALVLAISRRQPVPTMDPLPVAPSHATAGDR